MGYSLPLMAPAPGDHRAVGNPATVRQRPVAGSFVDGSGWEVVYQSLRRQGYNVSYSESAPGRAGAADPATGGRLPAAAGSHAVYVSQPDAVVPPIHPSSLPVQPTQATFSPLVGKAAAPWNSSISWLGRWAIGTGSSGSLARVAWPSSSLPKT